VPALPPASAAGAPRGDLGVGPAVPASRWLHSRGRSCLMDNEDELPGAGRDVRSSGAGSCGYPACQAGSPWHGWGLLCSRGGARCGESCAGLPAALLDLNPEPGAGRSPSLSPEWVYRSRDGLPAATSPELGLQGHLLSQTSLVLHFI